MKTTTKYGTTYTIAPHANLQGANLRDAYLQGADLRDANLRGAYLRDANLRGANLRGANLRDANLLDANLRGANLLDADLRYADLLDADLRDADLQGADLRDADLQGANLRGANLRDAMNIPMFISAQLSIVPEEGEFIGWKIARNRVLVKLRIPADAKRSNATGRKCRASRAEVLEVIGADYAISKHDSTFIYRPGETVEAPSFDDDRWEECAPGIHFFITRIEAEKYM